MTKNETMAAIAAAALVAYLLGVRAGKLTVKPYDVDSSMAWLNGWYPT